MADNCTPNNAKGENFQQRGYDFYTYSGNSFTERFFEHLPLRIPKERTQRFVRFKALV